MASLRMDELAAQLAPGANKSIPTDRTETPEESLEESILSILTSSNSTNLTRNTLDEAFCRDIEAFSEAFQVNFLHKSAHCWWGAGMKVSALTHFFGLKIPSLSGNAIA